MSNYCNTILWFVAQGNNLILILPHGTNIVDFGNNILFIVAFDNGWYS